MILYDAPSDLRGFARDLARANPGRDWLCRFMEPHVASGPAKSQAVLHELVERFRRRFGAAPSVPKGDG